jgi:hypothetical protein
MSTYTSATPEASSTAMDELTAAVTAVKDALDAIHVLIDEADDALEPLKWNDDSEIIDAAENAAMEIHKIGDAVDSAERALNELENARDSARDW